MSYPYSRRSPEEGLKSYSTRIPLKSHNLNQRVGKKLTFLLIFLTLTSISIIYVDGAEFYGTNVDHRFESPDFRNNDELWKSFTQAFEEYLFH